MKSYAAALTVLLVAITCNAVFAQAKQGKRKKAPQLPEHVELLSDIEFANPNGHSLQMDIYRPKNIKEPVPVVVFVHGGGWKNGSRKSGRRGVWLVDHGFAIASISYRLTDKGQWPDQINDCYAAVRFLRTNAEKYQLDGDYIGCWGTSAGGHLAALMGTRPYPGEESVSSRVQATCDWFGPSELLSMPPNNVGNGRTEADIAKSNGAKLLGATVRDVPDKAKDASALDNVTKDDSPFLIMHGTADKGVPLIQSRKLHDKLTLVGVPSTFLALEGAGHGGPQFVSPESKKVMAEFFTKHLKPAK